ncbi:MAG TPA: hypothetical protein ENJ18_09820, partial [Nannocystis exedens]|nr:hypothetical protein [Nannocystis exedens]
RGLAAAHGRNLVHRDFKPDNVLVGDDGRARVLDFGLAASGRPFGAEGRGNVAVSGHDKPLTSSLTRTGAVMGTPAYMAPEQFLARQSDARTDQFSFCVALYEALYRELPFEGEIFAARQKCVCEGEILPAPAYSSVPQWLRALLLRGLERDPEKRYSTMEALLQALADDPDLARARRLRRTGFLARALGFGILVIALTIVGWDAWERHRIESEASEGLTMMESHLPALYATGDEAEAERIFDAFVRNPNYRGTEALALAWLHRAEREAAASRQQQAIDAYAASYAIATSTEHQIAALIALIRFSWERELWDGLAEALATLEERASEPLTKPELTTARRIGAFIRRDFEGALLLLEGESPREKRLHRLVEALAPAHKTSVRGILVERYSPAGNGEYAFAMPGKRLLRVRADLDLTAIATHSTGLHQFQALPVEGEPHYIAHDLASGENVILRADRERLTEISRFADDPIATTLAHDLTGDGRSEIYIGTGPYTRHIRELVPGEGNTWSTRPIATTVDNRRSDVNSIVAGDLNGDGRTELVVALGPWQAYEIQVLRWDSTAGELQRVTRKKLGNVDAALVRRGPGPPEIAVWKNDEYTSPLVFPPDKPKGEAAGLHLYRLVDDRLQETARYLAPTGVDVAYARVMVGDLDGDDRDEIVVHDARESSPGDLVHTTLIFTQDPEDPEGSLLRLPLAHAWPLDLRDLDGDGDAEILVRLDDEQLWVVGGGAQRLPQLDRRRRGPKTELPDAPEVFTEVWQRSADLAQMGLKTQAAEAYSSLASTTRDPKHAAWALLRAAQLYEDLGRDELAAQHYAKAAQFPGLAGEAGVAAHDAYRRRGELGRSRALLDELLGHVGELSPRNAAALRAARAELGDDDADGMEFDFSQPMDSHWQIHQPHALHRKAARSTLRVDAVGTGLAAALPLTVGEGLIVLEVELDLHRVEWGETFEIGLAEGDANAPLLLGIAISGEGGRGDEWTSISCHALDTATSVNVKASDPEVHSVRYSVRVVLDREEGEMSCTVIGPKDQELLYRRVPLLTRRGISTATELRILSRSATITGWIDAELHRLSMTGLQVREAQPLALRGVRQALVEGDLSEALRFLDGGIQGLGEASPDVATWRLLALAQLGRWEEAEEVLAPLLVGAEDGELPPKPLMTLLRTMPAAAGGLLRAAGALEHHRRWLLYTWGLVIRFRANDPVALRVVRHALEDLDPESDVKPEVHSRLFSLRASVHVALGMYTRGRDDFGAAISISRQAELDAEPEAKERIHSQQIGWSLQQASAAIRAGDLDGGREIIVALLNDPVDEVFVRDMLRAMPEFTALGQELGGN